MKNLQTENENITIVQINIFSIFLKEYMVDRRVFDFCNQYKRNKYFRISAIIMI